MNALNTSFARPENRLGYRSTSGAIRFRARQGDVIPMDQLASLAPSVFADDKHGSRSAKYSYIDTAGILQGLLKEGFVVVGVQQGGSRVEGKREFTKHKLSLRHRDWLNHTSRFVGMVFPELSLGNSHDGTSAYTMDLDLFRLICLNGMTTSDAVLERIKVPHKGDVGGQVIEGAFRVMAEAPRVMDRVESMSGIALSDGEQLAFARAASELRWDAGQAPVEPAVLLTPRRFDDRGADLWRTFNRTQEHLLRGGDAYVRTVRDPDTGAVRRSNRTVGEVRNIDDANKLNKALFTLGEEMRRLKEAA
jgi:hypothetical protein